MPQALCLPVHRMQAANNNPLIYQVCSWDSGRASPFPRHHRLIYIKFHEADTVQSISQISLSIETFLEEHWKSYPEIPAALKRWQDFFFFSKVSENTCLLTPSLLFLKNKIPPLWTLFLYSEQDFSTFGHNNLSSLSQI